jgi:hypothetical protein
MLNLHKPRGLLSQMGHLGKRSLGSTVVSNVNVDGVAAQPLQATGWRIRIRQAKPPWTGWERNWTNQVVDVEVPLPSSRTPWQNAIFFNQG